MKESNVYRSIFAEGETSGESRWLVFEVIALPKDRSRPRSC